MDYKEYIAHLAKNNQIYWVKGIPWSKYKAYLRPLSHPHIIPDFCKKDIKKLLKESNAFLAIWTYDFNSTESEWWWIIAERPYSIDKLKKKDRYYIKFGLKNCTVRLISGQWLADNGFSCYRAAIQRHTQTTPLNESAFKESMPNYDDNKAYEIWGVFYNNSLVGYSIYSILDTVVYQEDAIFNPEYFKYSSSYALIHVTTDYYLNERKYLYITTGTRSISHETQYQEFLIKHFNYRKAYCKLGIQYSLLFGIIAKIIYLFKPIWQKVYLPKCIKHNLEIIYKLTEIQKSVTKS